MERVTWQDMHNDRTEARADAAIADALRWYKEEHPDIMEAFSDLIEVSLYVGEHWRGATVKRTDNGDTLAEYDLD